MSFWHPEFTSLSAHLLNFIKNLAKPKVENLIKQLFHSRLLDMRLVIANSYQLIVPRQKHYCLNTNTVQVSYFLIVSYQRGIQDGLLVASWLVVKLPGGEMTGNHQRTDYGKLYIKYRGAQIYGEEI